MKTRIKLLLLLVIASIITCQAQEQSLEEVLLKLDEAVARREESQKKAVMKLNAQKIKMGNDEGLSPFDVAKNMTLNYDNRSIDSAIYYSKQMLATAGTDPVKIQLGKIWLTRELTRRGEYAWSENMLKSLGDTIYKENLFRYYQTWDLICIWQNEHISPNNEILSSNLWSFADSVYKYDSDIVSKALFKATTLIRTDPHAALDSLKHIRDKWADKMDWIWIYLGKRLALCYQELGIRDSAEYYFALSAIADMEEGIVEHSSLHLLSLMLLEDGDIERAYHYNRADLIDALRSGSRLRLEQVSRTMPTVLDSYFKELGARQQRINTTLYILCAMLLFVTGILFYTYRINKRLAASRKKQRDLNDSLKQKKKELEDALKKQTSLVGELAKSSKTKEMLVGQYMRQCLYNIQQLEHYRLSLQKVANYGNMDKLVTAIKKNEFIEKELKTFYNDFDESFLHLFPHFIEDFNALLREENRIAIPEGKKMNVALRIYALIRLGFNESEEIAKFLHYSTQTIYNYRSRIRNAALCAPEEFEDKVRDLNGAEL